MEKGRRTGVRGGGKEGEEQGRERDGARGTATPGPSTATSQFHPQLVPNGNQSSKISARPMGLRRPPPRVCSQLGSPFEISSSLTKTLNPPASRTSTGDRNLPEVFLLENHVCGGTEPWAWGGPSRSESCSLTELATPCHNPICLSGFLTPGGLPGPSGTPTEARSVDWALGQC